MRSISSANLSALTTGKQATASLTFRRRKPIYWQASITDSLALTDPANADMSAYGTGFLRVVRHPSTNVMYVQYVTDPSVVGSWPAWVSTGVTLKAGSRPGVHNGTFWFQLANGNIGYSTYPTPGTTTVATTSLNSATVACAPVDSGCYLQYVDPVSTYWLCIEHITTGGTVTPWQGRVYGDLAVPTYIDAVTLNGIEYIYTMDRNIGRVLELTRIAGSWSFSRYVIPIDAIDNITGFTLYYATVINNQIFLTGRNVNASDSAVPVSMDIIIFGPTTYSFSRWSYLTTAAIGGKMFVPDGSAIASNPHAYYVGVNSVLSTETTVMFGYDNPNLIHSTGDFFALNASDQESNGSQLVVDFPSNMNMVNPFDDVDFAFGYNGDNVLIGKYTLMNNEADGTFNSRYKSLLCLNRSFHEITQYTPHQSYYIASQDKSGSNPADLTSMVINRGLFSGDPVQNSKINQQGIMYSTISASRAGSITAKFKVPSDTVFKGKFGLIANYYQESSYDVATRLGVNQDDVTSDLAQDNGLLVVWSETEFSGAPGFGVYVYVNGVPQPISSVSFALTKDIFFWLTLTFIDGKLNLFYRPDGTAAWTTVISTVYTSSTMPWQPNTFGRPAIFMENITKQISVYGFDAEADCIGLDGTFTGVDLGDYIMDDEIINISGFSPNLVLNMDLHPVERFYSYVDTVGNDSNPFIGNPIEFPVTGDGTLDETGQHYVGSINADGYFNDCCLVVTAGQGAGKAFKITGYDWGAPPHWVPTVDAPDGWQSHVGDKAYGYWGLSVDDTRGTPVSQGCRVFVEQDPGSFITTDGTTTCRIVRGLMVGERGKNSTEATSHDAGLMSRYTPLAVLCGWANVFTADPDWTLEGIVRYVVEGAGGTVKFNSFVDSDVATALAWELIGPYGDAALSLNTFVGDFSIPALSPGDEIGAAFRLPAAPTYAVGGPNATAGYMITIMNSGGNYFASFKKCTSGTWTELERFPILFTPSGTAQISVQDSFFSLWVNNYNVASFQDSSYPSGDYMVFTSKTAKSFHVHIPELTDFISMWAISASSNANQVLGDVLSDRRVFFADDGNGGLRFYRVRSSAGVMPDIGFAYKIGNNTDVVSWTRGEGAKFIEEADPASLEAYGIRYADINTRWALTVDDTIRFARWFRADQKARATSAMLECVPHPAYQAGDYINVEGIDIDIIGLTFSLEIDANSVKCLQSIQGIGHAEL